MTNNPKHIREHWEYSCSRCGDKLVMPSEPKDNKKVLISSMWALINIRDEECFICIDCSIKLAKWAKLHNVARAIKASMRQGC